GVDMEVAAGECWGLLGPNGAGKTTLLRMITGSTPPSGGHLEVLGYPIPESATAMRRHIGIVPQSNNLDPDFTVLENLRSYASFFGLQEVQTAEAVRELLAFAALESKADAHINTLSGGMQRRLSLIRGLVNDPELLIMDEPTTGLDPQARQLIWQRLRELRGRGMTLILTTHYMEEAERLCDRVTVMDHGRILDTGTPRELIARYIEPQVIEVHGPGMEAWHERYGSRLAERSEVVGETVFYYLADEKPLLDALRREAELVYLHRRANLEDVFLKLTGRELRDED
ncbi:MAG: ABC transporter ATP-binding protein, partial [Gammaproteobacteria bacterium]